VLGYDFKRQRMLKKFRDYGPAPPRLTHGSMGSRESAPKRYLDRLEMKPALK